MGKRSFGLGATYGFRDPPCLTFRFVSTLRTCPKPILWSCERPTADRISAQGFEHATSLPRCKYDRHRNGRRLAQRLFEKKKRVHWCRQRDGRDDNIVVFEGMNSGNSCTSQSTAYDRLEECFRSRPLWPPRNTRQAQATRTTTRTI